MKRIFHSLVLIFCISTSASAQNYYDVSEFRDQLPQLKETDVVNFSKKDTNAFVTSCSLDTVSRILYYYHCYGGLFSYQPMSKPDMNAILAKKITPFEYFDLVTTFNVNLIEKAKKNLEDNGSNAKFTSLEKQYLDIADSVKFPSTLTKLLELDKQMVSLEVQDTRFHSVNPKYIKRDRSYYKTFNDLQGQMVIWRLSDSIATFYSKSDEPPVYKAVLDLKKAVICFYNRSDSLVDKIEINKSKVALLASKESDVFALYRMWLEWKRQSITQAIEETKISGRVAENKQYALNVLSEQVKMLSAIDYKIEYFTNADKQFVLQKLRRQFGAIFAPNDPWETGRLVYHTRGDKRYELTDHRGNVMVVISDMKKGIPRKDDSTKVDHYEAIVLGATDYTPFGNPMQGRSFNSDKYPYGYNGKEDDNETGYENYGMRIYDPRVARFLSVDPIAKKYPQLTPYQFGSNSPIAGIDKDGKEFTLNNWAFDIWLDWKFGDPTGVKELVQGAVEKAQVQTGDVTYHRTDIPKTIQENLDFNNTREATRKIINGTGKVVAFTVRTSADVISTFAPLGEAVEVSLRGTEIIYNGIKAERILLGSSDKIAVIGREFDKRVLEFAAGFEKQTGTKIETFRASAGAQYSWKNLLKEYAGNVPEAVVKKSLIYRENVAWAQKIKDEGYKVFDTGLGTKDIKGTFYKAETETIFSGKK